MMGGQAMKKGPNEELTLLTRLIREQDGKDAM